MSRKIKIINAGICSYHQKIGHFEAFAAKVKRMTGSKKASSSSILIVPEFPDCPTGEFFPQSEF
jgi:hypothetical protein